jgi:hypothetical protein
MNPWSWWLLLTKPVPSDHRLQTDIAKVANQPYRAQQALARQQHKPPPPPSPPSRGVSSPPGNGSHSFITSNAETSTSRRRPEDARQKASNIRPAPSTEMASTPTSSSK